MATSYTTLIASKATPGSILNWTNVTRVDPATCVAMAEDMIFSGYMGAGGRFSALRCREMRVSASLSLAADASTLALPTRFLDPITLYNRTDRSYVQQVYEESLVGHRSYDDAGAIEAGTPTYYAIFDELLQFDVKAEATTALTMVHYARPAALSGGNPTNWLTDKYGTLLLKACCAAAYEFDDDMQNFQKMMAAVMTGVAAINAESDLSRRGIVMDRETP